MPSPKLYYVQKGKLYRPDGGLVCAVGPRTGWPDWLAGHRSFRYESLAGASCTVIKEQRSGRSGITHPYWYAHRRINGRLRRVYLGRDPLTLEDLEKAAGQLAQLEIGDAPGVKGGATL